jgi:hypothetical protein
VEGTLADGAGRVAEDEEDGVISLTDQEEAIRDRWIPTSAYIVIRNRSQMPTTAEGSGQLVEGTLADGAGRVAEDEEDDGGQGHDRKQYGIVGFRRALTS